MIILYEEEFRNMSSLNFNKCLKFLFCIFCKQNKSSSGEGSTTATAAAPKVRSDCMKFHYWLWNNINVMWLEHACTIRDREAVSVNHCLCVLFFITHIPIVLHITCIAVVICLWKNIFFQAEPTYIMLYCANWT